MRPMYQCTESLQTTWSLEDGYTVNACSPLAWTCHIGCMVSFIHRTHRNLRTQLRSSVISDRQQNKPGWGGCSGQFVLPPATIQWQKNRVKVGPGCWCIAESDAADWIPGCWPITSPCLCRWEMTARSDCRLEPWFAGHHFWVLWDKSRLSLFYLFLRRATHWWSRNCTLPKPMDTAVEMSCQISLPKLAPTLLRRLLELQWSVSSDHTRSRNPCWDED